MSSNEDAGDDEDGVSDDVVPPLLVRVRRSLPVLNGGRPRSRTLSSGSLRLDEREAASLIEYPEDVHRPRTREDCDLVERPCPFVSCVHHLYLDVNGLTGAMKLNFPHLEVWELEESCSLDVADRGGLTLEDVGEILNITRERVRQVEVKAVAKVRLEVMEQEKREAEIESRWEEK